MSAHYETFEHEADIGIRGFGNSMKEAFENAAVALYSVMVNIDAVNPWEERTVAVSAPDRELLLVEWLNALLAISDIERLIFSKFDVKIEGTTLTGAAWGETLDWDRHEPRVEVKGATYHLLSVKEQDGKFTAQCVVDV
jgi:tRNA nucleotidyltransferase (CCA-adding enzyme)